MPPLLDSAQPSSFQLPFSNWPVALSHVRLVAVLGFSVSRALDALLHLFSLSEMSVTRRADGYCCFGICGHSVLLSLVLNGMYGLWILLFSCIACYCMGF